jgi:hypothetical protein
MPTVRPRVLLFSCETTLDCNSVNASTSVELVSASSGRLLAAIGGVPSAAAASERMESMRLGRKMGLSTTNLRHVPWGL